VTLRRRVGMAAGTAVGIAIVIAAIVTYWVVQGQLVGQVDDTLRAQGSAVQAGRVALRNPFPGLPPNAGGPAPYVQVVLPDGRDVSIQGNLPLPVDSHVRAVAGGRDGPYLTDVTAGHAHLRELIFPETVVVAPGRTETAAIQLARPLSSVDHVLSHLRLILILLCAGGIALAAALGRLAARRVLAPLGEVAQTATYITETDDLSKRLGVHADDEVGELATRFNTMLEHLESSRAALDDSMRAQRQLVADASHELRTPVTSLRTNIEVLLEGGELSEEDRRRLLADVVEQSEELTALVSDLIELARGDEPTAGADDVRLDRVVEGSVARARRNAPGLRFELRAEPVTVEGFALRLERAVNNLLDNASRHSPPGGTVEVEVTDAGVRVRDHGTGIDGADLPHVFDRFYRGANVRGQQGSGLGLAIVRQVTEQHGGSVSAANGPGGGAVFTMTLPALPARDAPLTGDQERATQDPEQATEHRQHGEQGDTADVAGVDDQDDGDLDADRGDSGEEGRVGAVSREMLARGEFDHPKRHYP
jgi:two-component system, OmpR family, sensor histidine kinase MprB